MSGAGITAFWVQGDKVHRVSSDDSTDHGEWIAQHLASARQLAKELESLGWFDTDDEEGVEAHIKVRERLIDEGLRRGMIRGRATSRVMWLHSYRKMSTQKLVDVVHLVIEELGLRAVSSIVCDVGLSSGRVTSMEVSYRDLMSESRPLPTWKSLLEAKIEDHNSNSLRSWTLKWQQHPGVKDIYAHYKGSGEDKYIYLQDIRLHEGTRGQGLGTQIVEDLQRLAAQERLPIVLYPVAEGRKKGALERFYKRLGFKWNRGRSTDYRFSSPFSATMVWHPPPRRTR